MAANSRQGHATNGRPRNESAPIFLIDAQSPRVDALLNSPEWSRRVVGTFYPDVEIDVLCEEVG
ncbi:hypothetical protein [Propionivibrio sp.]|uniref:hypothetical protein n=1 Tax=Propionivibrio sp. TaxID=2212460 RepID=UPI0025EA9715|nr:hypothetical protein [Propionivibrio sp.]MBK7357546.1 hypothetical protein [Propionivibrio sp.]